MSTRPQGVTARLCKSSVDRPRRAVRRWWTVQGRAARRHWRSVVFAAAGRIVPYLTVKTDIGTFVVATADQHVSRSLYVKRRRKEIATLERVVEAMRQRDLATAGTTFVDIGANIGTSTLAALRTGFGSVVAIEPEPRNFRLLLMNLEMNGVADRVQTVQAALSDRDGTRCLRVRDATWGRHRIVPDRTTVDGERVVEVRAATADRLVDEGTLDAGRVGLLWIDAEGHEPYVLAGASHLIARSAPLVLEFCPRRLDRAGALSLLARILERGYTHVLDLDRHAEASVLPIAHGQAVAVLTERHAGGFTDIFVWRESVALPASVAGARCGS